MGNMDDKKSFLFYESWLRLIDEEYQDPKTRQELISAIVRYGVDGVKSFPCERMFLKQVFVQIDSAKEKWENLVSARREAGKKGGKASGTVKARYGNKNASKTQANANKRNHNENENVNVNDNDNDNDNSHSTNTSYSTNDIPPVGPTTLEELEASGVIKKRKRGFYS